MSNPISREEWTRNRFNDMGFALPPVPAGWVDTSYINDSAASYEVGLLRVWIDHVDPLARLDGHADGSWRRFTVDRLEANEDDLPTIADEDHVVFQSDCWVDVLWFVRDHPLSRGGMPWYAKD